MWDELIDDSSEPSSRQGGLSMKVKVGIAILIILLLIIIVYLWRRCKKRRISMKEYSTLEDEYADYMASSVRHNSISDNETNEGILENEPTHKINYLSPPLSSSPSSPSPPLQPNSISCEKWVEYITGMPESELRKGDNITKVFRIKNVPEYKTHRFFFVNVRTNVEYDAGYFYTETIGSMQREFDMRPGDKKFRSCKLIADLRQDYKSTKYVDIAYMQANSMNNGCMFQAASNFNGIEAISEETLPDGENFITNYINDNTQGPMASISAGAAGIARVLLPFYDMNEQDASQWRQTGTRQVELLGDLKEYCTVKNGYVVQSGAELVPEDDWDFVKRVRVGVQVDAQVSFGVTNQWEQEMEVVPATAGQHVSQVFCAAMNMKQGPSGYGNAAISSSERVSKLLLEAAYRGTYLAAIRHGAPRLYLTLIGGGVFGNDVNAILDIIKKVHLDIACTEKNTSLNEVHVILLNEPSGMIDFLHGLRNEGVEVNICAFRNEIGTFYTNF